MDVPVRFIDSIINNPLLMQFLVHRWFFLLEYDPRLDQLRVANVSETYRISTFCDFFYAEKIRSSRPIHSTTKK